MVVVIVKMGQLEVMVIKVAELEVKEDRQY
jgi:hypothetical protein